MEINRNNYQAWFLDYRDNTLDAKQQQVLATFLENNPDLQDEFLDFNEDSIYTLTLDEHLVFESKHKLKKIEVVSTENINQSNYEDFIIAHLENDLDENQQFEFTSFIALNPSVESEIAYYKRTFLDASDRIIYPNKLRLKKSVSWAPSRQAILMGLSIAALLVLVLMITNSLVWQSRDGLPGTANQQIVLQPLVPIETPAMPAERLTNKGAEKQNFAAAKETSESTSDHPVYSDRTIAKTNSSKPAREKLPPPAPVGMMILMEIEPQLAANTTIEYRTEVSETFRYMLLRDARVAVPEPSKGTLGRIADNIAGKLFGNADGREQQPLLTTLAQNGKHMLMDIRENMPLIDAATQVDSRDNYIALNENFSIRIRKSPKGEQ